MLTTTSSTPRSSSVMPPHDPGTGRGATLCALLYFLASTPFLVILAVVLDRTGVLTVQEVAALVGIHTQPPSPPPGGDRPGGSGPGVPPVGVEPPAAKQVPVANQVPVPSPILVPAVVPVLDVDTATRDVPEPYRAYVRGRPAWLKADQSAEVVYLADRKAWMLVAVASSPLDKQNPRTACELKALAAVAAGREGFVKVAREFRDGNATVVVEAFAAGRIPAPAVVGEWVWPDGRTVSVLFGTLLSDPR